MPSRQPAKRTRTNPAARTSRADGAEPVEIRLIARDGLAQTYAHQIAAAIPGCPPPSFYPSRKTPGRTLAYLRFTVTTPPALDAPEASC
ncbi:hypothetical protein ACFWIA_17815 [Streptomyces sp. NPDC127068]|uniref:hypothetical protein n=1 Tax=Streptomyces sp. NPDC127068 TaxID=3347127 RepID=UPI00364B3E3C